MREFCAGLALAVAWRGGQAISDRIGGNDEIFVSVESLARTNEEIDAMMISRNRGGHQDRIVLFLVQLPMRNVGNHEIFDGLAALEFQIALFKALMRSLLGRVSNPNARCQQHCSRERNGAKERCLKQHAMPPGRSGSIAARHEGPQAPVTASPVVHRTTSPSAGQRGKPVWQLLRGSLRSYEAGSPEWLNLLLCSSICQFN